MSSLDPARKENNCSGRFRFEYGTMDDGTVWIAPPSGNLFHIDPLALRIILELNSGAPLRAVQKKYGLTEDEIRALLEKFNAEKAIGEPRNGRIQACYRRDNVSMTPVLLLFLFLALVQLEYFKTFAATFVMRSFHDALAVGIAGILAVFFHETGHYLAARNYFIPRFGLTFLSVFPAIYVDTQAAWCLPRNVRLLINSAGAMADMLVNAFAIALVVMDRRLEYFVTPFLVLQYTRLTVVFNPLFSGDGYWLLSDISNAVNLSQRGRENLRGLKFNLFTLFGGLSLLMGILSTLGFLWFVYVTAEKLVAAIRHFLSA